MVAVGLVLSWILDVTFVPTMPGAAVLMTMRATTAAVCHAVLTR